MADDAPFMRRALFLAGRARGRTTPNPLVGSVVVSRDGLVVGSGFHARAGEPHAEVHALREAGAAAQGATLYCTLEPCCHHGRTPPCAQAIVEAGVSRVVAAMEDPNPRVSGGGLAYLRAHGVAVDVGVGRADAEALNRPFLTVMRLGRPWVLAKIALSAEGCVAAGPGRRTSLSGPAANRQTQVLRAQVDAVGVGAGTVLADDPLLTCREVYRHRPLTRVVFDRRLRTLPAARLFGTLASGPVCVVTGRVAGADADRRAAALREAGATLIELDEPALGPALAALAGQGIQALLLEGGPTLHRAALAAGLVDAVRIVVTPRVLGPGGVPWVDAGLLSVAALDDLRVDPCGPDVIIEGHVHRTH